ncbi:DUF4350 domain-containing protein [Actinomycetes bacterium KLBMP 9797]
MRRWHRIAIPLGVAALLFTVTGVTYAVEQADPADTDFLSPVSTAPIGGSRLAAALRAKGVEVRRFTRTSDALVAAQRGDATLFVPAPAAVHPEYLRMLSLMPAGAPVVLVDPPARTLDAAGIPVTPTGRRWATKATAPDCALREAIQAGTAAALRQRYDAWGNRCYGSGLAQVAWTGIDLVVIGASDPFRNDRIGEHGNEALAAGLLGNESTVVWLDVHRLEPPPGVVDGPTRSEEAPPSLAPDPRGSWEYPGGDGTGGEPRGEGDGEADGGAEGQQGAAGEPPNPLWDAFPAWFWALLVQLALAALVFALRRARRLGPPVGEPLPAIVRGGETVLGRGRLYRRAKARGPTADILRRAARHRVIPLLSLPPDADADALVDAVANQTGRDRDEVDALLYGPAPETEEELRQLARDLDVLAHAVSAPPSTRDEGEQR